SAISLVLQAAKPFSANSSLAARRISSLLRSRMLDIGPIRFGARGRLAWPRMLAPAFDSPQARALLAAPLAAADQPDAGKDQQYAADLAETDRSLAITGPAKVIEQ